MNTLLEARWEEGVWLGRRWGSVTHLVGVGREVFETRAVQRKPKDERWDAMKIQNITATPWRNPAPSGERDDPVVLPPLPADEAAAMAPAPVGPSAREGPKQVYIRDSDLAVHGYTVGCRRCMLMREGQPSR